MPDSNDNWEGLTQGDVVQYKDKQFLYRGINPRATRNAGIPERPLECQDLSYL